jgi:hypothetical protein
MFHVKHCGTFEVICVSNYAETLVMYVFAN